MAITLECERCGEPVYTAQNMTAQADPQDKPISVGYVMVAMTQAQAKALREAWNRHEDRRNHTCRLRAVSA